MGTKRGRRGRDGDSLRFALPPTNSLLLEALQSEFFKDESHTIQSNTIIYKIYIIHIFSCVETIAALTNIGKSLGRTSCSTIRTARVENHKHISTK
jgi:hypothetical protein